MIEAAIKAVADNKVEPICPDTLWEFARAREAEMRKA
jgi:hypothetical protein